MKVGHELMDPGFFWREEELNSWADGVVDLFWDKYSDGDWPLAKCLEGAMELGRLLRAGGVRRHIILNTR